MSAYTALLALGHLYLSTDPLWIPTPPHAPYPSSGSASRPAKEKGPGAGKGSWAEVEFCLGGAEVPYRWGRGCFKFPPLHILLIAAPRQPGEQNLSSRVGVSVESLWGRWSIKWSLQFTILPILHRKLIREGQGQQQGVFSLE